MVHQPNYTLQEKDEGIWEHVIKIFSSIQSRAQARRAYTGTGSHCQILRLTYTHNRRYSYLHCLHWIELFSLSAVGKALCSCIY